jgi:D-ribulokinase
MQQAFGTSSRRAGIFDEEGTLLTPAKSPIGIWHEADDIVERSTTNKPDDC